MVFIVVAGNIESTQGMLISLAVFLLLNTSLGPRVVAAAPLTLATLGLAVGVGWLVNGWLWPGVLDPAVEWLDTHLQRLVRLNVDVGWGDGGHAPVFGRATGYLARRRKARAMAALDALHREPFRSRRTLAAMPAAELRALAAARGDAEAARGGVVEKAELAARLELDNPCSICLDEWREGGGAGSDGQSGEAGDVATSLEGGGEDAGGAAGQAQAAVFLKCGHYFHDACIRQWAASATELSDRPVACPFCNTPLDGDGRNARRAAPPR